MLELERTRVTMGRFVLTVIVAYSIYAFLLGTAIQFKAAAGRSEIVSLPVIGLTALVQLNFMRRSGYPARFFGVTFENAGRHAREALALIVPLLALVVALKMLAVRLVPGMRGAPVFEWTAGMPVTPVLILAYVVLIPFQELVIRGGLQGALEHFLVGRRRTWKAILGSNVIFSAAHLYISSGLSVAAFLPGLFWGWLYSRQRSLVGVSLSHLLLGFWAFYVVGIRLD